MELEDQSEEEENVSYHNVDHVTTERQMPASTVYREAISGSCILAMKPNRHALFVYTLFCIFLSTYYVYTLSFHW